MLLLDEIVIVLLSDEPVLPKLIVGSVILCHWAKLNEYIKVKNTVAKVVSSFFMKQ